ncbi:Polysaccharide biosynthesis protein [Bacillus sp. 349Y]|nr:Polysaccharide biosynthesis protein [Bacillus sp. 349Y]
MNNIVKKIIGFSLGPVVGAFIAFITIPLTTYFVNPEEFGKASMFVLLQLVFGTFMYLGIDQSYTREYHVEEDKKQLFMNALIIPLAFSLVFLILVIIKPQVLSILLFEEDKYILESILFSVMIIFMILERFILLSIRMEEKAFEYSILNIIVKLSVLISTLIFVAFVRQDFLAIIYSAVIGQIIGDIYLLIRYREKIDFKKFQLNKKLIKRMLIFGIPLLAATSLSSLLNSLDRIFLRAWSDFYELGIFAATLKIAAILNIVQTSFTSLWIPIAYRWFEEKKEIVYFKVVSEGILLLMTVIFFFVVIFKGYLVQLLSSEYSQAQYLIAFLCLQPLLYTLSETTSLGIAFSRKSYLSIWVSLFSLIPNIIFNILLIPVYGAKGAAVATAISYLCFFAIRTYLSSKNGFKFSTKKHHLILSLLFIVSIVNSLELQYTLVINLTLLILSIVLQTSVIKVILKLYSAKKNKSSINISQIL